MSKSGTHATIEGPDVSERQLSSRRRPVWGWAERAPLHGLTTRTDGPPVIFFPPTVCKACGEENANEFAQPEEAWKICAASPGFE